MCLDSNEILAMTKLALQSASYQLVAIVQQYFLYLIEWIMLNFVSPPFQCQNETMQVTISRSGI